MRFPFYAVPHLVQLVLLLLVSTQASWANSVVWSCSRAEPQQTVFEGIRAFRMENLSAKDDNTISITLMDLYGAYGGQTIQMGKNRLAVCSLPPEDPLQKSAMALLGYTPEEAHKAAQTPASPLIVIPSIHRMQKCLVEHHPAIGFFEYVIENEKVAPCF